MKRMEFAPLKSTLYKFTLPLIFTVTVVASGCTLSPDNGKAPPRPSQLGYQPSLEDGDQTAFGENYDGAQATDEYPVDPNDPRLKPPNNVMADDTYGQSADADQQYAPGSPEALARIAPEKEVPVTPIVPAFPAKQPAMPQEGGLQRVHFDFDSAGLDAETRRILDANIALLQKDPKLVLRLEGHTDEIGTSAYNLGLGMHRSQTVRDYLINQGIGGERLITSTYGEEMPLRRSSDTESFRINRRVEFAVVNNRQATAAR